MNNIKTNHFVLMRMLAAMLLIALTGCTNSSEDKKAVSEEKTSIKEVRQETRDLIQTLGAYTVEQREEAIQRTQATLDNLDDYIDSLEKRIDNNRDQMNMAAREKARANLIALRKQRAEVYEWAGRLKTSSADTWEHTKKGFSAAVKNLGDAWEKSVKEFGVEK